MAKEFAKAFYNSKAWEHCRDSYIARRVTIDGGLCETCHDALGYIVHHKEPLTPENIKDPTIALNHELLEYDCKQCHDRKEGHGVGKEMVPVICAFDDDGAVIGILPPFERARA